MKEWEEFPFRKFEVVHVNLDSVYQKFKDSHIFSLPSQDAIIKDRGFMTPFRIETKDKNQIRQFRFGDPVEFKKELSAFQSLRDYKAILDLFEIITLRYNSIYYALTNGK